MKISSKARYGLYAVTEMARNYGEYLSTVELAERTGVTEKYLELILSILKKNGIVKSARGASGGYILSDLPENISVGRVIRSLENNLEIVGCINGGCGKMCGCTQRSLWEKLYSYINDYLDKISLKQLAEENI